MSLLLLVLLFCGTGFAGPNPAFHLLAEHLPTPRAVDNTQPRLSWAVSHTSKGQRQTAFHIQVYKNAFNTGVKVWDTNITSSETSIAYGGSALVSDSVYYWQVTWADSTNTWASPSEVTSFETGLFNTTDWRNAVYLAGSSDGNSANNLFRKDFTLPAGTIVRARAYVVGLGYYHLFANGQKASVHALAPGWTQYQKRILYVAEDVTSLLKSGANNTFGVMLGNGWRDESAFPNLDKNTAPTDTHREVLKLVLTVDYGQIGNTSLGVISDGSWKTYAGPVTSDSVYNGETYDARREQDGWTTPTFDSSRWSAVATVTGPPGQLSGQVMPAVLATQTFTPIAITSPSGGVYIADMGQNFQGYTQITLRNPTSGTRIQLRHAETLNDNGDGNIYTDNLRSAKATDIYYARGLSTEVYVPYFTYHGYRFVEITGWPGTPTAADIKGIHIHSNLPLRTTVTFGSGEGTNNVLNMVQNACVWGQRSNLMTVATDCDQRDERLGWMGDLSLSSESIGLNFQAAAFYTNAIRNIMDEQDAQGTVTDVVPFYRYGSRPGDPAWGAAYPQTLWTLWKHYGDMDTAQKYYNGIKSWLNYLKGATPNLGSMYSYYGDWVPPPPAPKCSGSLVSAFNFIANSMQASEIAGALGLSSDVQTWNAQVANLSTAFNSAWFKSSSNTYDNGVQTCVALALRLGLVPSANLAAVQNNLLNDIVSTHGSHFTTGITGVKFLLPVLVAMGRADVAVELALGLDYPSWGWMMVNPEEPATTIWELMDAPEEGPGMNSRNHHMYSSVSQHVVEAFAGVSQTSDSTGFAHVVHAPVGLDYLSRLQVQLDTSHGNHSATWSRDGGVQCGKVAETHSLRLDCGSVGGTISAIQFASFGRPVGGCGNYGVNPTCHASNSTSIISSACLGKQSCTVLANNSNFGDPCYGSTKWLHAQVLCSASSSITASFSVPTNKLGTLSFPLLTLSQVTLKESGGAIWVNGAYQSGVAGVTGASVDSRTNSLQVQVGSGDYSFMLTGVEGNHVCGQGAENSTITLNCPTNTLISRVNFASFGNLTATCSSVLTRGICHAGSSKTVVERACLGKASCQVAVTDTAFGDPCLNIVKNAVVDVVCSRA